MNLLHILQKIVKIQLIQGKYLIILKFLLKNCKNTAGLMKLHHYTQEFVKIQQVFPKIHNFSLKHVKLQQFFSKMFDKASIFNLNELFSYYFSSFK